MKRVPARSAQPAAAIAAAAAAAAIGIGGKATPIPPRRPPRLAGVDFGLPWNAGELGLQLQTELSWVSSLLLIRTLCAAVIRSGGAREIRPAVSAYEKQGYRTVSRLVSPEGIALRRLQKRLV